MVCYMKMKKIYIAELNGPEWRVFDITHFVGIPTVIIPTSLHTRN